VLQIVYISLPYIMAAEASSIDRNVETTSLSSHAFHKFHENLLMTFWVVVLAQKNGHPPLNA